MLKMIQIKREKITTDIPIVLMMRENNAYEYMKLSKP